MESFYSHSPYLYILHHRQWGRAADIWGRRPTALLSVFLLSICVLVFGLSRSLWFAALIRFCTGLAGGGMYPTWVFCHVKVYVSIKLYSLLSLHLMHEFLHILVCFFILRGSIRSDSLCIVITVSKTSLGEVCVL